VDDHQTANAQWMVKHDAAICIQQKDLSANWLAEQLKAFLLKPEKRMAMANQAYQLRKVHVAERIFGILSGII
jgi:UDP-N-acetylglucosamine--N-acetylmuramyl-(pentapeptide) pyrophosphoryl-undecaprenol N-acetylglucosamine transferase